MTAQVHRCRGRSRAVWEVETVSHRSYEFTSMIRTDDLRLAATESCAQAIEETSPGTASRFAP